MIITVVLVLYYPKDSVTSGIPQKTFQSPALFFGWKSRVLNFRQRMQGKTYVQT